MHVQCNLLILQLENVSNCNADFYTFQPFKIRRTQIVEVELSLAKCALAEYKYLTVEYHFSIAFHSMLVNKRQAKKEKQPTATKASITLPV